MKELSIEKFVIFEDESSHEIFKKIEDNTYGIVFVVNRNKQLLGAISDGDIRRGIINYGMQELDIKTLCNFDVFSVRENSRESYKLDSERMARDFKAIPVVGSNKQMISILVPTGREETKTLTLL